MPRLCEFPVRFQGVYGGVGARTIAAALLAMNVSTPAATAGEAVAPRPAIEEIIVTATKRSTDLSTTALAISALPGNFLDDAGARDFNSYFRQVPGLTAIDNGAGRKRYILRGVNSQQSGMSQATVAQYVDEVPITNNFDLQPDVRLVDVERIEVLRGPQGTLFGARSMAGTIRTITRKPVFDRVEGSAGVTVSDTKFGGLNSNLEGVANIPLGSNLVARVSGFYAHDEGYVDNHFPGGRFIPDPAQIPPGIPLPPPVTLAPITQDNFSDVSFFGGRASVRWVPTERLTVDLMGLGQKGKITGVPSYDVGATGNEANGLITAVIGNRGNDDKLLIGSGTASYDLDGAQLTVIGSTSKRDNFVLDAAPASGALFGGGPGSTNNFGGVTKSRTFEARATSVGDGPWQWLVGGYAFHQMQSARARQFLGFGSVTVMDILSDGITDEASAFGELSYEPVDRFKLTVGARYSNYKNRLEQNFLVPPPGGLIQPGINPNPPHFREDSVTTKYSASYEASRDLFVYATVSQGFRPGSFIPNAAPGFNGIPEDFQSDSLWNYEIGAKSSMLERRLSLNGSLYRIDWSNMQTESFVRAPVGPALISFTTNASSARIVGLELEATAVISEALSANLSFNHFFEAALDRDAPINPLGFKPRAGDRLPFNPKTSFSVGMDYRRPLTAMLDGFAHVDVSYTGRRTTGFRPLLENGQVNNAYNNFAPYGLLNVQLGVQYGQWRVAAFADNLTDERPVVQQSNFAPLPVTLRVRSRPRTVGMMLRTNY